MMRSVFFPARLEWLATKRAHPIEIIEKTIERQCDPEYVEEISDTVPDVDAVLSMACGAGVQYVAERYPALPCIRH